MMAVKSVPVDDAASLLAEFHILSKFHKVPGIIQCIGKDLSHDLPGGETCNLLLKYAAGGSLSDLIANYGRCGIPERDVKVCTLYLLEALSSVHAAGYTHCDIKPDNVLVFPDDDGFFKLKIADFGLATDCPDPKSKKIRGTPRYLPREMIISGTVSPAMDIWALGCTVLEMLTGERPFSCVKEDPAVMWKIAKGGQPEIPECLSDEGKDFLRKCFDSRFFCRSDSDSNDSFILVSLLPNVEGSSLVIHLLIMNKTDSFVSECFLESLLHKSLSVNYITTSVLNF
ncbi:Mitogen-activated protein kinase kinase kinase 20 [Linum grandiflorum]